MKGNTSILDDARIPSKLIPDEVYSNLLPLWPSLLLIICPFGLWSNALVIRTFLRMGLNDSVTISFFTLGLSDFAQLFCPLANVVIQILNFMETKFQIYFRIQNILLFVCVSLISGIFNNLTTYITTFLAVQRCLCIVKAMHFKDMFTKKGTWCSLVCFFLLAALPMAIFLSSFTFTEIMNPFTNITQTILMPRPWYKYTETYVGMTAFTILPILCQALVLGSVIVMSYGLRASIKFRKDAASATTSRAKIASEKGVLPDPDKNEAERINSKERIAILQVAVLSTIFLVTNVPKISLAVVSVENPDVDLGRVYENLYFVLVYIRLTCDYINSTVNFFVYYKYNSRFRKLCFASKPGAVKETS